MTFYMWFIIFSEAKGFGYGLVSRAVDSSFKPGGPIVESKPQMMHFTVVALDFPKNRDGQARLAHTLTTTLVSMRNRANPPTKEMEIRAYNSVNRGLGSCLLFLC